VHPDYVKTLKKPVAPATPDLGANDSPVLTKRVSIMTVDAGDDDEEE
jgi:hypothetical protein